MKTVKVRVAVAVALALLGCDKESIEDRAARLDREAWQSDDCADVSTLLATTTGSPSEFKCPNHRHRMRVQVATHPSNEEAAALVFCECEREPAELPATVEPAEGGG